MGVTPCMRCVQPVTQPARCSALVLTCSDCRRGQKEGHETSAANEAKHITRDEAEAIAGVCGEWVGLAMAAMAVDFRPKLRLSIDSFGKPIRTGCDEYHIDIVGRV